MDTQFLAMKEDFLRKHNVLEQARSTLKQEFFGIDQIIDEIIDNLSSWYFFPELQERPAIINLWGLTGVGKTSVINRLVELINYQDYYYKFDLGNKEGSYSFQDALEEICENKDSSPVIIALDEFQHSRTISGPFREEINTDKNRMIWELIDSGKIQHFEWKHGLWSLQDFTTKLSHLLKADIKVENGLVISKQELFCNEIGISFKENEKIRFIPEDKYTTIIELAGEKLNLHLEKDIENLLLKLTADETIKFLKRVIKIGKAPSFKNFTKALIFVIGNLDEAYSMSNNFSADIDADEFNKSSQKITVPKIKMALQNRFRNEQIARLGNIHIIYPALSKKSYQKIIEQQIVNYAKHLKTRFKLNIVFDKSIHKLIYKEGVYPTQGVRPIFTSMHQILKSKISHFYAALFLNNLNIDSLHFSIHDKKLTCDYLKDNESVHYLSTTISTTLEDIRKNKQDDLQAITAVHESGHVVLSMVLLKVVPNIVCSITTDGDSQGFVHSNIPWDYISRKELIPRVAMMLGGYVAEELIFGSENLTAGASSDIEKATSFLSIMYKNNGMGRNPITYETPEIKDNNTYHQIKNIEKEIKAAINEAKKMAINTLINEQKLLLSLSNQLSDKRKLKKEEIENIAKKTLTKNIDFIEHGDHLFYRNHLKTQFKNIVAPQANPHTFENVISLNKNSTEADKS